MEKTKIKVKTKSINTKNSNVSTFILIAAIIAFIGGYALSGEIKDRTFRIKNNEKENIISDDVQIAGGNQLGNKTLGFNENLVVTDNYNQEYNVLLGTYMGVNDAYFDIQYGTSKNDIAFVKYSNNEETSEYFLLPFESKVVDLHMSTFDMNPNLNTIFFLLEDGTVEYMLIEDAIARNDFRSFGKLEGLTNIAKFYEGTTCEVDSSVCTKTAFAQSIDGRIYDLYNYIH